MFTDSNGRYITAGQWHDEKFYTFTSPEKEQLQAPAYLLLGGMTEAETPMEAATKTEVDVY